MKENNRLMDELYETAFELYQDKFIDKKRMEEYESLYCHIRKNNISNQNDIDNQG